MITLDFSWAVASFLSFATILVFSLWIFYNYCEVKSSAAPQEFIQCTYCGYVFWHVDFMQKKSGPYYHCPQCKSYLAAE